MRIVLVTAFFNNVVITTVIEMVEMVEILDGRLGKRSVERVRYVINNLLHLVIVKYGDISLVLCISTRLRLVTILPLLVKYLVILHADPCNKSYIYTRKMVPIPRRASSFLVVVFIHVNRKEEEERETDQQRFTKGCNILHRLQVYHLTLTFIIHNKYTSTLYLYTYIHIPMIALIIMPFIV